MMEINVFQHSTPQLAALVEVPERRVFSWIERGYISPSVQAADGPGRPRIWSRGDVRRAQLIAQLEPIIGVPMMRRITAEWRND